VNDSQVCNRNAGEAVHWPVHQWRNERTLPQFTRHLLAAAAIGRADPVALIGDGSRPTTRAAGRAAIDLQARALDLSAAMLVGPAAAFANMARSLGSRRRLAFVWWQNLAATSGSWSLAPRSPRGGRSRRSMTTPVRRRSPRASAAGLGPCCAPRRSATSPPSIEANNARQSRHTAPRWNGCIAGCGGSPRVPSLWPLP